MKYTMEIPMQPNEFIQQLEESSGRICMAKNLNIPINRYRFFWKLSSSTGKEERNINWILKNVVLSIGAKPYWVTSWRMNEPSITRAKFTYSKRNQEGWQLFAKSEIYVAVKCMESIQSTPKGYTWQDGGIFILMCEANNLEMLVADQCLPTLTDLALSRKLRPGIGFINFLEQKHNSCIYFPYDDLGRKEIVVLTKIRIYPDQWINKTES